MRIGIVGAGALGLYYGALLQRGGQDVHFLLRSDYDAIRRHGLKIFSVNGDFELPQVQAYLLPEEIGPVDLVVVGLKTFANARFEQLVGPLVGADTQILTLQNGLGNEEALAALFGEERIIGGVAFLCSNRGAPGEVHHLGAGRIVVGEFKPGNRARLETLSELFQQAGVECRIAEDLIRARWEKLVWNIPFNGLCALLQQPVDCLLAKTPMRKLVREIMLEVIEGANAQGLAKPIDASFADAMIEFTDNMGKYQPSMQIDRQEGRELEIEGILRTPQRFAQARGVSMPRVEMLASLLEQAVVE